MVNVIVIGDHEERTVRQLERCVAAEDDAAGVLCADGHVGYSQPVGGVVAYRRHISVVGRRLRHRVREQGRPHRAAARGHRRRSTARDGRDRRADLVRRRAAQRRAGRPPGARLDPRRRRLVAARAADPRRRPARHRRRAATTTSTCSPTRRTSSGSACTSARAASATRRRRATSSSPGASGDGMDAEPALLSIECELGQEYIAAMELAGAYAYAGREWSSTGC